MSELFNTSIAGDIADAARTTIDIIDVGDIADAVTDTAGDAVEIATLAGATGGRLVVRSVRAGGNVVRQHPKGSLGTLALILAVVIGTVWFVRRDTTSDSAELKVAA